MSGIGIGAVSVIGPVSSPSEWTLTTLSVTESCQTSSSSSPCASMTPFTMWSKVKCSNSGA